MSGGMEDSAKYWQKKTLTECQPLQVKFDRDIELSQKHWVFLERWLRMVYEDAFQHGYRHGAEDAREDGKK